MEKVYVANATNQNFYVLVSKRGGWEAADLVTDVALLFVGATELKIAAGLVDLPDSIRSLADLVKFLKWIAAMGPGSFTVGSRTHDAVEQILANFKKIAIQLTPGDVKDVCATGGLSYLNPSTIAGLLSADTLDLTIMSEDATCVADFNSNQNANWIIQNRIIVRSAEGGALWQPDPGAGSVSFGLNTLHGEFNQFLAAGATITSDSETYQLTYQTDGNLVVTKTGGSGALWQSNTAGQPAWQTYMQPDGNLVVYKASGQPVWASNTKATAATLIMQDDGNAVIYDGDGNPIWATNTANR